MNFKKEEYSEAYYSKKVSTNDVNPQFLNSEVNRALSKTKAYADSNSINFVFITDIHYTCFPSDEIRLKRMINIYHTLKKQLDFLPLFIGGDHIGDGCVKYKKEMFRKLSENLNDVTYFPINGNHDDGTIWGMKHSDSQNKAEFLSHKDLFSLFYSKLENAGCKVEADNKLYYLYYDINNKMRYIVLDVNDVPYIYDENNKLKYNGQDLFILSQQQLEWLGNQALKFNEDGWSVVVLLHGIKPDDDQDARYKHLVLLKELVGAFKNGKKIEFEYGNGELNRKIKFDFSEYLKADIIGYFAGDAHDNLYYRDKFDIPYIITANAFPFYYDPPTVKRNDGDTSEICLKLITINKLKRKIYVTAVGYGQDYVCQY